MNIIFSRICVMFVLWCVILLITAIMDHFSTDDFYVGWFASSIGFAVFLTETLIHHGII